MTKQRIITQIRSAIQCVEYFECLSVLCFDFKAHDLEVFGSLSLIDIVSEYNI